MPEGRNPLSPLGFSDFENLSRNLTRPIKVTSLDGKTRIFGSEFETEGTEAIILNEAGDGPNSNGVTHYVAPKRFNVSQSPDEPNSCAICAIAAQVDGLSPTTINKLAIDLARGKEANDIPIDWNLSVFHR